MRRMWIGLAAVLLLAGAAVADRLEPPRPPLAKPDRVGHPGGVWACPVVKMAGTPGWLHLVNIGRGASTVRITYVIDGRKPIEQALLLASGRAKTIGTPGALLTQAAGAIVEYAGGRVTVSRTTMIGAIAGAASCARPGAGTLVLSQGSTLKAETQLVLLNPGGADAVVDVALLVNGRVLEPESLSGRVVPARSRLVIREGDFAFDARAVAAMVTASAGRVVIDGILTAPSAVDLIPGVAATREVGTVASSSRGTSIFSVVAIGEDDAVTDARVLTVEGPSAFGPLVTALEPDRPLVAAAGGEVPGAVALDLASSTAPIAIGARWQVKARSGAIDSAISAGMAPSKEVVAVLGPPASSPAMRLLIANPDAGEATIDATVITETGGTNPVALSGVKLEAGRSVTLTLQGISTSATVGVVVRSRGARVVVALEATIPLPGFSAYAVTGVPTLIPGPVAVEPDPRQGVPAP